MDFELSSAQHLLRESTARFAAERIAPGVREREKAHAIPHALVRELAEQGLLGVNVPAIYGGVEAGAVAYALALREVAGIRGALDTYHIGFMLGPRLNAAGRMGSATTALQLLLSDDADEAQGLAAQVDAANTERRAVEARIVEEAMAQVDAHFEGREPHGVVAAGAGWHVGTIGIVASRLVARYRVPAVVIGLDEAGKGRGSARSARVPAPRSSYPDPPGPATRHARILSPHPRAARREIRARQAPRKRPVQLRQ